MLAILKTTTFYYISGFCPSRIREELSWLVLERVSNVLTVQRWLGWGGQELPGHSSFYMGSQGTCMGSLCVSWSLGFLRAWRPQAAGLPRWHSQGPGQLRLCVRVPGDEAAATLPFMTWLWK